MGEYIVIAKKDHYNHLGIVRTLGEAGICPILVTVKGAPKLAAVSKYVKRVHYVNTPEEGVQLIISQYTNRGAKKGFILTGDDVSVALLDKYYDELKDHFYFFNAGETGRVRKYMDKAEMCSLAARHGFSVPKTWKVKTGEVPDNLIFPIITKATHSYGAEWKEISFICRNHAELLEAYEKIQSDAVVLQEFVEKDFEGAIEGFSINHGKDIFLCMKTTEVYSVPGKYAPYWHCKNCNDRSIWNSVKEIITEIGFEGIFGIDYMVGKNGREYFLEINFRNTAVSYAMTVAGMPVVTQWCESMERGYIAKEYYKAFPENFTTMAECYDYDLRVKTGMIDHKAWMQQYKKTNAKLYRGRNDFRPFFSFMWYKITRMRH